MAKSIKVNYIYNTILTSSNLLFQLITFPYISRTLLLESSGTVAFASSVASYFTMFASLGIPTYGIRTCAKYRDDKEKLSKTVHELLAINCIMTIFALIVMFCSVLFVPKFNQYKALYFINMIGLLLNAIGMNWLYSALEKYQYITLRTMVFKGISLILIFLVIHNPEDYLKYAFILIFATGGSNICNFYNSRKYVCYKKYDSYNFKQHIKPILTLFATTVAISIYTNLDLIMIGFIKGDAEVGIYNTAIKIRSVLLTVVTSLGTVILPRLSYYVQKNNKKEYVKLVSEAIEVVLITATSFWVFFSIVAKECIVIFAGEPFIEAVTPLKLLLPILLIAGLSNVTGYQMLVPNGRESKLLNSIICGSIVDFILNIFLIPIAGAAGAAISTLITEIVVLIVQIYYVKVEIVIILKQKYISIKPTICSLLSGLIAIIVKLNLSLDMIISLIVCGIVFWVAYLVLIVLLKEPLIYSYIKRKKENSQNEKSL